MPQEFVFSIIKVVPDPVKEETVNVGAIVLSADGRSGDLRYTTRFKTRAAALHPGFPVHSTLAAIEDLRAFVGLEGQLRIGEANVPGNLRDRLFAAVEHLEGQLQLTVPKPYQAESLAQAVTEVYQRYVTSRLPGPVETMHQPTAAELRNRIWQTVRRWQERNIVVEKSALIRGREARHAADFVLKNGTLKAAIFALPAIETDRHVSFLYRDSLPTIARDVQEEHPGFQVLGVFPDVDVDAPDEVREFVEETQALLRGYPRIRTVGLSELPQMRDDLIETLI